MCGRFTLRNLDNLETKYGSTDFEASYNIGPGQKLLALTDKLQSIEWGFTPYWADKPFNLVNARIETLTENLLSLILIVVLYQQMVGMSGENLERTKFHIFIILMEMFSFSEEFLEDTGAR